MDVEHLLVCAVVAERDVKPVLDAGITPDFFDDDEHRRVFMRLLDLWKEHGQVPSAKALKQDFPRYRFQEPDDAYTYYIDELRKARKYALLHETIAEAATVLRDDVRRPDPVVDILAQGLNRLYTEVSVSTDTDLTETTQSRLERYKEIGMTTGLLGIPTGFASLDRVTSGLQPEQLITFIGEPKVGKSTILMRMAIKAHEYGKVPLLYSFEMSEQEQSARHDAIRAGVSHTRLTHGKMTAEDEKKLLRAMHNMEGRHPFIMATSGGAATTVSSVAAKIEQHRPDLVIVDGVYLMQDEHGETPGSPQALTNLTRDLKRLAQRRRVPIVIATQVLTWKFSRKRGLTSDAIGYSSSFAQDSDLIFGAEHTDEKDVKKIRLVIGRNAPPMAAAIRWDWETMAFDELDDSEYDFSTDDVNYGDD